MSGMRMFALIMALLFTAIVIPNHLVGEIKTYQEYVNTVESYWNLSVRASTLDQKSAYLDKFVTAIENADLRGYDALFFFNPDDSYDQNLVALKSLQTRMREIKGMDVTSFQYQQAISQITAQEQGEAHGLLSTFQGLWFKNHYYFLWGDIDGLRWLFELALAFIFWIWFGVSKMRSTV